MPHLSIMTLFPFDLHTHSDFSDGDFSPEYVFRKARRLGLKGIVLTDHNTTRSTGSALSLGEKFNLETIEGIEISVKWIGLEVHILGYSRRFDRATLEKSLRPTQRGYTEKVKTQLRHAKKIGLADVTLKDLRSIRPNASFFVKYDVARALSRATKIPAALLTKRLNRGGDLFVPYGDWALSPHQVLVLMRRVRGVASLAHPGALRASLSKKISSQRADKRLMEFIALMARNGLRALEVRHPDHGADDEQFFGSLVKKFRLLPTGGSDYHGEKHHPERPLGQWGLTEQEFRNLQSILV